MRKFLFILFLFTSTLFSIEYYESNEIGLRLNRIKYSERNSFSWVLYVMKNRERVHEKLFNDEILVKSIEKIYSNSYLEKEIIIEDDIKIEKYFKKQKPLSEKYYIKNNLEKEIKYFYKEGKLQKISEYDASGNLIFNKEYSLYSEDSRLKKVVLSENETEKTSLYKYDFKKGLKAEAHLSDNSRWFVYYSDNGDVLFKEKRQADELLLKEIYTRSQGNLTVEKIDNLNSTRILQYFDSQEKLVREKYFKNDKRVYDSSFVYKNNLLVSKDKKSRATQEKWNYIYNDDVLEKEEYFKNNDLKKVIVYKTEEDYDEVFFSNGKAFLKIFYEDNKKVKEEILN